MGFFICRTHVNNENYYQFSCNKLIKFIISKKVDTPKLKCTNS